jgi:malonate transporter and related proteins
MQALLDVILPVFIVIGAGYLAAWKGGMSEAAVDGVMKFAQNFAVPVMLFNGIAHLDLATVFNFPLMASFYTGSFAGFAVGFTAAKFVFQRPATDSVAIGFACLFSNSLQLGIPITERAFGPQALAANYAIVSIHAPLLYTFGVLMMELARTGGRMSLQTPVNVVKSLATNPLVIGILCGLVVNLTGLGVPPVAQSAVDMMVSAAIPAALFGLGGLLVRYRIEGDLRLILTVCAISLLLHPAISYVMGSKVFHLDQAQFRSVVTTASMPPGVNAYLFASIFGFGKRVAAASVLIATALAVLSVWFWLSLLVPA